ncbi:MAG: hypothetical protein A2X46_08025 [Lentisphaerae bacterium GWF2_57_35]|nr:MAG: hypothetical protein A2X46_08025 [Lentisphaerae bacterium GWF2_57_35]
MYEKTKRHSETTFFTGITRGQWTGYILLGAAIFLLFFFVYVQARRSLINEIRHHVMGVAAASAAGLDARLIQQVWSPADVSTPAYRSLQERLDRIALNTPDIRYIYTMRRSLKDQALSTDYEYVVDASARDRNNNQEIDPDEICEPPGKDYSAQDLPELVRAWYTPAADRSISADPPYPDLISGYAPIRNHLDQTVAIVGVDITASTVQAKLLALQSALWAVWLIVTLLIVMLLQLYYRQQEALEQIKSLSQDLTERNETLRAANLDLAESNERFTKDIRLAQSMQLRLMPRSFPHQDKIRFDKLYLAGDLPGGDFFDVFALDDRHLALFMADVSGHGMSTALVSGLLKAAFSAAREKSDSIPISFHADLWTPGAVLAALNEMLIKEIPEYEFITMIYAVIQLDSSTVRMARAGHPAPIHFSAKDGVARLWDIPAGAALGLIAKRDYPAVEYIAQSGDKMVFFTDGLPGALNEAGEAFGEERLLDLVQRNGSQPTDQIIAALNQAIEGHRGSCAVSDDYTLLIAEIC